MKQWSKKQLDLIWEKAIIDRAFDPSQKRRDVCGALIAKASYGMETEYGWEVDHIYPVAKGGGDELSNLQPLHWENNRSKADGPNNIFRYCKKLN